MILDVSGTGTPLAGARWKTVGLITAGHALVDLCQGMVPALLPFLVSELDLSYAAGAGLVFASSAASSIVQPLFGYLADRASFRWLLPASVLLTGAGVAFGAQSPSYAFFFLSLIASSLGVAAFHPEAARQIHRVAGPGRATEMSIFSVGGNVGFASAPMLTIALVVGIGRAGTLLILLPAGLIALLLAGMFRAPQDEGTVAAKTSARPSATTGNWHGFLQLSAVTICRSIVFAGLNTFLALYWMSRWDVSPSAAATMLAVFLATGIGGILLGGWLADRLGRRAVLAAGFGTAALLLPLLLSISDRTWATAVLVLLALAFFVPSSLLVVLGQGYLPHRIGVASGVTLGLAISVGGMVAPALGQLADCQGVESVLYVLEIVLLAAAILAGMLPRVPDQTTVEVQS